MKNLKEYNAKNYARYQARVENIKKELEISKVKEWSYINEINTTTYCAMLLIDANKYSKNEVENIAIANKSKFCYSNEGFYCIDVVINGGEKI